MKYIPILILSAIAVLWTTSEASAQSRFYHPNNHNNFGPNHYYGPSNYGRYNGYDPMRGYCLTNDCFGGGGGYGYGQGCGGSCGHGCSSPSVIVRVQVSGGQGGASPVQTYYPGINNGCNGCGYYGKKQNASPHRAVSNQTRQSRTPAATQRRSPVQKTGYRYRF